MVYVQGSKKEQGQAYKTLRQSHGNTIKWKHSTNGKQGKIGIQETKSSGDWFPSGDLTVIFPPIDVIQVLPGGVYAVLPLTSPLEVFCTIITVLVCMDLVRGPHQTLSKNQ